MPEASNPNDLFSALNDLNGLRDGPRRTRAKDRLALSGANALDWAGLGSMKVSDQQRRIIESEAPLVKVEAGAGCGKSSCLEAFARVRPKQKILSLAFNATVAKQAQARMPKARVQTSHAYALAELGPQWREGKALCGSMPLAAIRSLLDLDQFAGEQGSWVLARLVEQTLRGFWASADDAINESHLPRRAMSLLARAKNAEGASQFGPDLALGLARQAQESLRRGDRAWPVPHDAYLKLFCLQGKRAPFDCLLLDEAQDTNPALLAWFLAQRGQKVLVGDAAQAIYGFRGALNAMQSVPGEALPLSRSWRFGSKIADCANAALFFLNQSQPLEGAARDEGALLGPSAMLGVSRAYIARSNASLLSEAARAASRGQNIHFVGGKLAIDREAAFDCMRFAGGETPKDPWRACFDTFDEYEEACRETGDTEGMGLCALARERGSQLPALFDIVDGRTQQDPKDARLWLCSAHKAKGLEFDHVALADDFVLEPLRTSSMKKFAEDERDNACVFYVAATRAKQTLSLPDATKAFADKFARAFERPDTALREGFNETDASRLVAFKQRGEGVKKG